MWVMNVKGFSSAVHHKTLPDSLMVRGRDHASLEDIAAVLGITDPAAIYSDWPSDYPYRIVLTKAQYKEYLCAKVDAIEYGNFKDAAEKERGDLYHDVLSRVWMVMLSLTPLSVKADQAAAWGAFTDSILYYKDEPVASGRKKGKRRNRRLGKKNGYVEYDTKPLHTLTDDEWNRLPLDYL